MVTTLRRLAVAQIVAIATRALLAALLHWSLAASSPSLGMAGIGDRLVAFSVPILLAIGLWLAAPLWASWIESAAPDVASFPVLSRRAAWVLVGTSTIVIPVVTLVASWVVALVKIAIALDWSEGRSFLAPEYYSFVVTSSGPQVLAGALLLALARHLPEG